MAENTVKPTVYECYIAQAGCSMNVWLNRPALELAMDSVHGSGKPFSVWRTAEYSSTSLTIVPRNGGLTFHAQSHDAAEELFFNAEGQRIPSAEGAAHKTTAGAMVGEPPATNVQLQPWPAETEPVQPAPETEPEPDPDPK